MMTIVPLGFKSLRLELDVSFCVELTAKLGGNTPLQTQILDLSLKTPPKCICLMWQMTRAVRIPECSMASVYVCM